MTKNNNNKHNRCIHYNIRRGKFVGRDTKKWVRSLMCASAEQGVTREHLEVVRHQNGRARVVGRRWPERGEHLDSGPVPGQNGRQKDAVDGYPCQWVSEPVKMARACLAVVVHCAYGVRVAIDRWFRRPWFRRQFFHCPRHVRCLWRAIILAVRRVRRRHGHQTDLHASGFGHHRRGRSTTVIRPPP